MNKRFGIVEFEKEGKKFGVFVGILGFVVGIGNLVDYRNLEGKFKIWIERK